MSHAKRLVSTCAKPEQVGSKMDTRVLGDVIREHKAPLLRYVMKLTFNDLHLAEDIVQETLLRAWQRPHAMRDGHVSMRPWLFTVARNLVFDHRRARNARPAETCDTEMETLPFVDDRLERVLDSHSMQQALATLTAGHRAVLVEIYYRGRSLADTAAALGMPIGTVKSRIHYALRALRPVVDELGLTASVTQSTPSAQFDERAVA